MVVKMVVNRVPRTSPCRSPDCCAFRDPHRFVQHALAAAGGTVWDLLAADGHLYLRGDGVRMAPAVRHARLELHLEMTGGTEAHAEAWLTDLRATGRHAEGVCAFSKQHRRADPAMPSGLDTAT